MGTASQCFQNLFFIFMTMQVQSSINQNLVQIYFISSRKRSQCWLSFFLDTINPPFEMKRQFFYHWPDHSFLKIYPEQMLVNSSLSGQIWVSFSIFILISSTKRAFTYFSFKFMVESPLLLENLIVCRSGHPLEAQIFSFVSYYKKIVPNGSPFSTKDLARERSRGFAQDQLVVLEQMDSYGIEKCWCLSMEIIDEL